MDTFAPEFSQFWRTEPSSAPSGALSAQRDDDTGAQKAALEELAERVSAARSVV